MFPDEGVVLFELDFLLDGLLILARVISVAFAGAGLVPYGDELYEMLL
jgi:hypothetical protein